MTPRDDLATLLAAVRRECQEDIRLAPCDCGYEEGVVCLAHRILGLVPCCELYPDCLHVVQSRDEPPSQIGRGCVCVTAYDPHDARRAYWRDRAVAAEQREARLREGLRRIQASLAIEFYGGSRSKTADIARSLLADNQEASA